MTLLRIQPIAPTWRKEPVDDPDWLFDLNYDGFRGLTYIDPGAQPLDLAQSPHLRPLRWTHRPARVAARRFF